LNGNIPEIEYEDNLTDNPRTFTFRGVSISEMKATLKEMKDNTDEFFLKPIVLLDAVFVIGSQVVDIINESFQSGVFAKSLKKSTLTPIQKKPGTTKINKHRPIHTFPCLEKLIENLAYKQLLEFIVADRLLQDYQSAF